MFNGSLRIVRISTWMFLVCLLMATAVTAAEQSPTPTPTPTPKKKPDFPPLSQVIEGYTKVISTAGGDDSLLTIWTREKDGQMLAALPRGYDKKRFFIALTVASGESYAGLQWGDMYVYWKRYDKRLALVEPNVRIRSTGDDESKDSVKRLYTDRIILDMPIVAMSGSSPVIDMDALLVGQASKFPPTAVANYIFGSRLQVSNPRLAKIVQAKAFPKNVELAFEVPMLNGRLQTLHYSISEIPSKTGYKPRKADTRVGYFTTSFSDYGKFEDAETRVRFINRWNLKKRESSLELSPPAEPIKFYIEHTTPVRYRRWIKQGILYWNKAFEKVGISGAIEVYYQDKRSDDHMEKDPEDVRYNFIRWLSNNQGTAIGPSRVHPETGQILDADIILTDGWIREQWRQFHEEMPKIAMESVSPETLAWLNEHPRWDPRVLLAPPGQRDHILNELETHKHQPYAGHPATRVDTHLIGDDEYDGLVGRTSQLNGCCNLARGRAMDVSIFRMLMAMDVMAAEDSNQPTDSNDPNDPNAADPNDVTKKNKPKKKVPMMDGIPESFIGPLLADLVCHEVGHTLGLRHNFKASAIYSMAEINSEEIKGKKPFAGSVMDYLPVNFNFEDGEIQGDYAMIDIGPYDEWAIQYGYTQSERDLEKILQRVAEPELAYGTDEDTYGPDPLARRYDFSSDPMAYARNQLRIAQHNRARIIDKLVQDGDSWAKTRRAYEMTLFMQQLALFNVSKWLGGAHIYRDKKGDKNGRLPIEVVSADKQREALSLILENTFRDEAFGLTEDLLKRMTVDKWADDYRSFFAESTWPVHDIVMSIQSSFLARIMYPTTLRRIYDNEFLLDPNEDALTLPELLDGIREEIWSELEEQADITYTARNPMISSLRRNLQCQHVELLIELSRSSFSYAAAHKAIGDLVMEQLRQIQRDVDRVGEASSRKLDPYTQAHLKDISLQVTRALEAQMIYRQL
ncbi:zinc-dependent metalloprotease [Planctomycetota bacterium]